MSKSPKSKYEDLVSFGLCMFGLYFFGLTIGLTVINHEIDNKVDQIREIIDNYSIFQR
jgi:hypothetical protein